MFALATFLIGALSLAEHLFGWDLGLDQLLFKEPAGTLKTVFPGRIPPIGAVSFALLGLALIGIDRVTKRGRWPAQGAVIITTSLAIVGLLGYAYGADPLTSAFTKTTPMALLASITFILFGIGFLFSRPDRGLVAFANAPGPAGIVVRRATPAVLVGVPVIAYLVVAGRRAGLYGEALVVALFAITSVALLLIVIWRAAHTLGRTDAERLRAERTLQASEERFRSVLQGAPTPIILVDPEGTIVLANHEAEHQFGYGEGDFEGMKVEELIPESLRSGHEEHRRGYFAHPSTRQLGTKMQLRGLRKDGTEFPVDIGLSSIMTSGGQAAIAFIFDITQRIRGEDELILAREEADHANKAKSEFLSRMSHELRTPLNAILGFGQLLEMREESPEDKEAVAHILTAGRHLLDLINETLDITAIDAGRLTLSVELVDMCEVTKQVCDLIAPLAAERDIDVQLEPPPASSRVMADSRRLLQVMLNLLSNAVKYNRRGGSIKIACELEQHDTTLVTVSDTGFGIDPEKMAGLLFKPFERLGAEASGVEGTGLGLALSKSLIEAMGGHLGASSEPDVGSTFWVRLPTAAQAPLGPERSPAPEAPISLPVAPARILYIEDNLSNLQLLENLFRDRPQYRLMSAMTGRLGLQLARTANPTVILLDLHLPDIGGEEVLADLKRDPKTRDVPVIVISADASPQTAKRVTSAGARAFVPKPLDLRVFLTALSGALSDRPQVGIVDRSSPTAIEQAASMLKDLDLDDE